MPKNNNNSTIQRTSLKLNNRQQPIRVKPKTIQGIKCPHCDSHYYMPKEDATAERMTRCAKCHQLFKLKESTMTKFSRRLRPLKYGAMDAAVEDANFTVLHRLQQLTASELNQGIDLDTYLTNQAGQNAIKNYPERERLFWDYYRRVAPAKLEHRISELSPESIAAVNERIAAIVNTPAKTLKEIAAEAAIPRRPVPTRIDVSQKLRHARVRQELKGLKTEVSGLRELKKSAATVASAAAIPPPAAPIPSINFNPVINAGQAASQATRPGRFNWLNKLGESKIAKRAKWGALLGAAGMAGIAIERKLREREIDRLRQRFQLTLKGIRYYGYDPKIPIMGVKKRQPSSGSAVAQHASEIKPRPLPQYPQGQKIVLPTLNPFAAEVKIPKGTTHHMPAGVIDRPTAPEIKLREGSMPHYNPPKAAKVVAKQQLGTWKEMAKRPFKAASKLAKDTIGQAGKVALTTAGLALVVQQMRHWDKKAREHGIPMPKVKMNVEGKYHTTETLLTYVHEADRLYYAMPSNIGDLAKLSVAQLKALYLNLKGRVANAGTTVKRGLGMFYLGLVMNELLGRGIARKKTHGQQQIFLQGPPLPQQPKGQQQQQQQQQYAWAGVAKLATALTGPFKRVGVAAVDAVKKPITSFLSKPTSRMAEKVVGIPGRGAEPFIHKVPMTRGEVLNEGWKKGTAALRTPRMRKLGRHAMTGLNAAWTGSMAVDIARTLKGSGQQQQRQQTQYEPPHVDDYNPYGYSSIMVGTPASFKNFTPSDTDPEVWKAHKQFVKKKFGKRAVNLGWVTDKGSAMSKVYPTTEDPVRHHPYTRRTATGIVHTMEDYAMDPVLVKRLVLGGGIAAGTVATALTAKAIMNSARNVREYIAGWRTGIQDGRLEVAGKKAPPGTLRLSALQFVHGPGYVTGRQHALSRAGLHGGTASKIGPIESIVAALRTPIRELEIQQPELDTNMKGYNMKLRKLSQSQYALAPGAIAANVAKKVAARHAQRSFFRPIKAATKRIIRQSTGMRGPLTSKKWMDTSGAIGKAGAQLAAGVVGAGIKTIKRFPTISTIGAAGLLGSHLQKQKQERAAGYALEPKLLRRPRPTAGGLIAAGTLAALPIAHQVASWKIGRRRGEKGKGPGVPGYLFGGPAYVAGNVKGLAKHQNPKAYNLEGPTDAPMPVDPMKDKKPGGTYICPEGCAVEITWKTPQDKYKLKCPKCSSDMQLKEVMKAQTPVAFAHQFHREVVGQRSFGK